MKGSRRRGLAALVVMLVAGLASLATVPAGVPAGLSADEAFQVSLSVDHPYEVRQVDIAIDHGSHEAEGVYFSVTPGEADPNQFWMALLPRGDEGPVRPFEETMTYSDSGFPDALQLDAECSRSCERSYLVVLGLRPGAESTASEFQASVSAWYDSSLATPLARVSAEVTVSDDMSADMGVAAAQATAAGQLTVAPGNEPVWRGTLHVSGAPTIQNGVGLIELHLNAIPSDDHARGNVAINVAGSWILVDLMYSDHLTDLVTVEWLEACQGESECDLPIELEGTWEPWPGSDGSIPQAGNVTVAFEFVAHLVFVGTTTIPQDATLELSAQ